MKDHFKIREVNKRKYPPPIRETLVCVVVVLLFPCRDAFVVVVSASCRRFPPFSVKFFFLPYPSTPRSPTQPNNRKKWKKSHILSFSRCHPPRSDAKEDAFIQRSERGQKSVGKLWKKEKEKKFFTVFLDFLHHHCATKLSPLKSEEVFAFCTFAFFHFIFPFPSFPRLPKRSPLSLSPQCFGSSPE